MGDGTEAPTSAVMLRKRKKGPNKRLSSKRVKGRPGTEKKNKVNPKMQKLYRKRARDYNSESDEDDENDDENNIPESMGDDMELNGELGNSDSDVGPDSWKEGQASDGEGDVHSAGITKFVEGCKAFRVAFKKIIKRHTDDETLGPVLSAHKKLVVAKLAEEETERKVKGEAKKEKHLMEEKGHVKPPANFLDAHEKFLIGIATKGVVKLFNAVNKAQNARKGLNPSRFKDAKALTKRRKEVFFSELSRASTQSVETTTKASTSKDGQDDSQPAWAPLRDTFMLTNSKLKDWDKMAE